MLSRRTFFGVALTGTIGGLWLLSSPWRRKRWIVWDPIAGADPVSYNVYRRELAGGVWTRLNDLPVDEPKFLDRSFSPWVGYGYAVSGVSASGMEGPLSEIVTDKA
jgi:hypothetical protein